MKMKLKRFLSLFASAAIIATTVTTVTTVTASTVAAAGTAPTTLFSDNFDSSYTDNKISKHTSSNNYTNLTETDFKVCNTIGIKNDNEYIKSNMEAAGNADNTFVLKNNAGVGSNKALSVTTQAGLGSTSWMIKNSGITSDNISGKELTFTANFMVPTDNGFNSGNGVLVYLDKLGKSDTDKTAENMPSTRWSFGKGMDYAYQNDIKTQTLLDIETEKYKTTPCVFAFGEKLEEIETGKPYSYKLTLTPNSVGTGYTAKATVNGKVYELAGTNLPMVSDMAQYRFAMIAEKANPNLINVSCSEVNKYQNDKTIAFLDDICLTAAEYVYKGDMLFSDDFSAYDGEYIVKAEKNEIGYYNTEKYILRSDVNSGDYTTSAGETKISAGDASRIAKLVDNKFASSSGKSLQLTSQGIVTNGSMYKLSNITEDKIKDKALVFNAKFKIPEDGIYNKGVGFAAGLSPVNADNTAPDAVCKDKNFQIHEDYLKNKYKFFAANGFDFYVFDKKMDTLKKGETYSFTLKMVPDTENVKYRIYAKLNDYEVEVFSDDAPTVKEMAAYKYSFIALHNHGYYTYAYSLDNGTSNYTNDQPLVYMDDISLESRNCSEVTVPRPANINEYQLFEDDFSNYDSESEYIKIADIDTAETYERNEFILNHNAGSLASDKEKFPDVVTSGNIERTAKVSVRSGFGDGKSLQLQSQGILYNASMWKKSNITYEKIKDKTLVFKTDFMIPSDGVWNSGTVAAITLSGKTENMSGQPDAALTSADFLLSNISSKYMLAGIGICSDYKRRLQVFGEDVSELENDKIYTMTVTMTPDANGRYSVRVNLNNLSKTLVGTGVPTAEEIGSYAYAGIINHSNKYNTSSAFAQDNPYQNDKDLICIDNISLNAEPTFFVSENGNNLSDGSASAPFKTIKRALSEARSGINTTIVVESNSDIETMPELQSGRITLSGKSSYVKLNLSDNFECRSDIVLDNAELNGATVFANGYKLEVTDSVTSSERLTVYGGGNKKAIDGDTNVSLHGGKYNRIYGGSLNAAVNGNTNIIFGGNCNPGDGIYDDKSNLSPCYVYGGGSNGSVAKKTNITIAENAVTKYIVGGGSGTGGLVGESTNINIAGGKVMNVYAGSAGSAPTLNCDTNITMTGGLAEGLFGGSEGTNLTGNSHIYLLGGEVTRRVFSGCYNATSGSIFVSIATSNHIKGTTTIAIDNDAKLITNSGLSSGNKMNSGIFAGSRISSKNAEEVNTIIFLNDSYDGKKSLIGDKSGWSSLFKSFETYTIKAGTGGSVDTIGGGIISVKPDTGMTAQVDGKYYEAESINISQGTTDVKFVKNFTVNKVTRDKVNKKITIDYTANNYLNNGEVTTYAAIYKKESDAALRLLRVCADKKKGSGEFVLEPSEDITSDDICLIKIMFINENLQPLKSVYETVC